MRYLKNSYILFSFLLLVLIQSTYVKAQTADDLAKSYGIGLAASIVLGPQAGTTDHYNYIMPDGREYAVHSDSWSWWSTVKYASGFVNVEAASKILPISFDDVLTFGNEQTKDERVFLILLEANPDEVLQNVNKVQEALDFKKAVEERVQAESWSKYPLQKKREKLEKMVKKAAAAQNKIEKEHLSLTSGNPPADLKKLIVLYSQAVTAERNTKDQGNASEADRKRISDAEQETANTFAALKSWCVKHINKLEVASERLSEFAVKTDCK